MVIKVDYVVYFLKFIGKVELYMLDLVMIYFCVVICMKLICYVWGVILRFIFCGKIEIDNYW